MIISPSYTKNQMNMADCGILGFCDLTRSNRRNHQILQSQNQQYGTALFVFLCFEYIIFGACGLFVKKNSGSFSAA